MTLINRIDAWRSKYPDRDEIDNLDEAEKLIEDCRAALANERVCEWTLDLCEEDWIGACGAKCMFLAGGPLQNDMYYCPECGGQVRVMPQDTED